MYSVHDAESKGIGWRRHGEDIVYYRNNLKWERLRLNNEQAF
jgi:hypothetical protein